MQPNLEINLKTSIRKKAKRKNKFCSVSIKTHSDLFLRVDTYLCEKGRRKNLIFRTREWQHRL